MFNAAIPRRKQSVNVLNKPLISPRLSKLPTESESTKEILEKKTNWNASKREKFTLKSSFFMKNTKIIEQKPFIRYTVLLND